MRKYPGEFGGSKRGRTEGVNGNEKVVLFFRENVTLKKIPVFPSFPSHKFSLYDLTHTYMIIFNSLCYRSFCITSQNPPCHHPLLISWTKKNYTKKPSNH